MNMNRIAILLAAGVLLAACAGTPPVTRLAEDVPSYCIKSRAAYSGHMDFCVVRTCPAGDITKANAVQNKSKAICAKPSHTAADLTAIKGLVNEQRAIGRAPNYPLWTCEGFGMVPGWVGLRCHWLASTGRCLAAPLAASSGFLRRFRGPQP